MDGRVLQKGALIFAINAPFCNTRTILKIKFPRQDNSSLAKGLKFLFDLIIRKFDETFTLST